MLLPSLNEAMNLVQDGIGIKRIDHVMTTFGMPVGPITLVDEVGIDIAYHVLQTLEKGYQKRIKTSEVIEKIYKEGSCLGKKLKKVLYL